MFAIFVVVVARMRRGCQLVIGRWARRASRRQRFSDTFDKRFFIMMVVVGWGFGKNICPRRGAVIIAMKMSYTNHENEKVRKSKLIKCVCDGKMKICHVKLCHYIRVLRGAGIDDNKKLTFYRDSFWNSKHGMFFTCQQHNNQQQPSW